ncbi:MAG: hypothetical protein HDR22_09645 [Lachnospiraceae bacterium]|nr:hypothetical protein [Lachnospiraceae bacterium]
MQINLLFNQFIFTEALANQTSTATASIFTEADSLVNALSEKAEQLKQQ